MSYGEVALHLGTCARAVGTAMKRNPYAPRVPCHRVIQSDRTLGGFSGSLQETSTKRKRSLLEMEGVKFDSDGRVSESCLYSFPVGTTTPSTSSSGDTAGTGNCNAAAAVNDDYCLFKRTQVTTKRLINDPGLSLSEKSTMKSGKAEDRTKSSSQHKKLKRCNTADHESHHSPSCPAISHDMLANEILTILHSRERGKTC